MNITQAHIATLIDLAIDAHGHDITPPVSRQTLAEAITIEEMPSGVYLYLWYNSSDNSTHVVKMRV